MLGLIIAFLLGGSVVGGASYIYFSKKEQNVKEELIKLKARQESADNLQEIIKRDFVELANQTIKNEQEDLRKQNRETLEEKILPLTKELGEFKAKIEKFNLSGVENTTKIVEQINNLEKNNKIIEQEAKNLVDALTKNQVDQIDNIKEILKFFTDETPLIFDVEIHKINKKGLF